MTGDEDEGEDGIEDGGWNRCGDGSEGWGGLTKGGEERLLEG